jgi:hypothetical protein
MHSSHVKGDSGIEIGLELLSEKAQMSLRQSIVVATLTEASGQVSDEQVEMEDNIKDNSEFQASVTGFLWMQFLTFKRTERSYTSTQFLTFQVTEISLGQALPEVEVNPNPPREEG